MRGFARGVCPSCPRSIPQPGAEAAARREHGTAMGSAPEGTELTHRRGQSAALGVMASPPALPRGQARAAGHRPQPYPLQPPASSQAAEGPAAPRSFAAARRHSLAPPGSPGALRPAGGPGWAGPGRAALPAAPAGCLKGGGSHRGAVRRVRRRGWRRISGSSSSRRPERWLGYKLPFL